MSMCTTEPSIHFSKCLRLKYYFKYAYSTRNRLNNTNLCSSSIDCCVIYADSSFNYLNITRIRDDDTRPFLIYYTNTCSRPKRIIIFNYLSSVYIAPSLLPRSLSVILFLVMSAYCDT